tara:strand:- start:143 stop:367 length:225 start_codon:yes stop_codon:yes gene_type:complete
MTSLKSLEIKILKLQENQEYIIELLHEINDSSRNKTPNISPNLLSEFSLPNGSKWEPPDHPGISNSKPIINPKK